MNDKDTSKKISRRAFLAGGAALAAGAAVPSALLANSTDGVEVTRRSLHLPGLPSALEGFRVAQVTDVHLYDGIHPTAAQALAVLTTARADLIVVTGDLWDTTTGAEAASEFLQALPQGVPAVAILGNHDYRHLPAATKPATAYVRGRVPLLVNEVLTLTHNGAMLAVIGLDDLRYGAPDPGVARRNIPEGATECWLIHEPGMLEEMDWPDSPTPRFSLSGHTHGGQIRISGIPPIRPRGSGRFLAGEYDVNGMPAYVSRGIGTSGIRMRVGCPPELPIFTLTGGL